MSWTVACPVAELEEDLPFSVDVDGELIALVSTEGEVFAIQDRCSHRDVMLSLGDVEDCTLECVAHGAQHAAVVERQERPAERLDHSP